MSSHRSITLATLTKDIRLEWRSKDALNAMLFFSLLVVVTRVCFLTGLLPGDAWCFPTLDV